MNCDVLYSKYDALSPITGTHPSRNQRVEVRVEPPSIMPSNYEQNFGLLCFAGLEVLDLEGGDLTIAPLNWKFEWLPGT
jgi:hypothetical protein